MKKTKTEYLDIGILGLLEMNHVMPRLKLTSATFFQTVESKEINHSLRIRVELIDKQAIKQADFFMEVEDIKEIHRFLGKYIKKVK